MLRSLISYYKLVEDMKNNGFSLNLYDPCVARYLVNGDIMKVA